MGNNLIQMCIRDRFDDRADEMFSAIEKSGLPVLIHAGWDPYDGEHTWAFPKDEADLLARHPNLKMILAHMGGMMCWDDVERYLVGKNVYFLSLIHICGGL